MASVPPGAPRRHAVSTDDEPAHDLRQAAPTPMRRNTRRAGVVMLVAMLLAAVVLVVVALL